MEKNEKSLSEILKRRDMRFVDISDYDISWTYRKNRIVSNPNIRSYLKTYKNEKVLVKVPPEFIYKEIRNNKPREAIFYKFDNPTLALKVAYILSHETDNDAIEIYDKDGFKIANFIRKKGIAYFAPEDHHSNDNIETLSLEQCFDRLCGIADYISFAMRDNDTAENLDRVSYRIQQITETLEDEVCTLYRGDKNNAR